MMIVLLWWGDGLFSQMCLLMFAVSFREGKSSGGGGFKDVFILKPNYIVEMTELD